MKVRKRAFVLLAATSLLAAGCSSQENVQTAKPVVIQEDVQMESSLADSSLELARQDDIKIGDRFRFGMFLGTHLYYNQQGKFHSFDVQTGKETEIMNQEIQTVSKDGTHGLSYEDEKLVIHNFQTGESKQIEGGSPENTYFANKEGTEVFHFQHTSETETVSLFNVDTEGIATWDLSAFESYSISYIQKIDGDVYLPAKLKNGYGIYQLKDPNTFELFEGFGGKASDILEFDLLKNGMILFQGTYDGKDGIFLYNRETTHAELLVSGGEDREGKWIPFYNLSPDENKIMFDTPVEVDGKYKANVYMGEIVNGKLTNSMRILEHADLYAVISYTGSWSEDSKTAYVSTNENGGSVSVFTVK